MNKNIPILFLFLAFLGGCSVHSPKNDPDQIISMQLLDRNGFSETLSNQDRLSRYQATDFLTTQPYEKVLRVYGRDTQGKTHSKITSYHSNGQPWQFLEAVDGRAYGSYKEWYENGQLKIQAQIIEGMADINDLAESTWLFEGENLVWDEKGNLVAQIYYDKGMLEGTSKYYHSNGRLFKNVPYENDLIEGEVTFYDAEGNQIEHMVFEKGSKEGKCQGFWNQENLQYEEDYKKGLLISGSYYNLAGEQIAEIKDGYGTQALFEKNSMNLSIEYRKGVPEGTIKNFSPSGYLIGSYEIKEGKKHGAQWEYYLTHDNHPKPKLLISWYDDIIQGVTKTWYENGAIESEREMNENKKQGYSFAYYKSGDLMMAEEYENDKLIKGSYFKKGEKIPTSKVENSTGIVTLFDGEGYFLKKITYEKGQPVVE